ncbi:MAG: response regulator transcription factor [Acidobacteriaceae bacterium]|nr:response regulator transcription factor [Acidobacteriaceae bacterium]
MQAANYQEIHVILADNQAIFRTGIARVLALEPGIKVVSQCSDATRLKEAVGALRRSIVIFPSSISNDLGDLLDWIEQAGSRSVMILEHGVEADEAVMRRVEGVVLRSVAGPQLIDCLQRVAEGKRSVQRASVRDMPSPDRAGARVLARLTPKEMQIIALVADGAKNKDIATQLGTKEQVVKNYLRAIYDKTGVSDRLELALYTVHHRALAEAIERVHPLRSKRA